MKYFPLGVGGHVDHGKTSLVKALTSIDTDRLPEEKRRGMSIDIGFAFLDFPELRVEIIDIPGHERFIKNAICGLAPVWGLLLVVDSSEGVMPQTVEHLRIAKAFGIEEVLVALTKSDKVDRQTLELAKSEALELLEKEGLGVFEVCPVSSLTGEGLELLKEKIGSYGEKHLKDREGWFFRFYVDSAFTVRGYGTVVRGSCVSGKVAEGDILSLVPLGTKCKVRKMQNHGVFVKEGKAGERLALNLPELQLESIKRGYFLVKNLELSDRLIVRLKVAPKGTAYAFFGMREVSFSRRHLQEDIYFIELSEPVPSVRDDRGPVLDSSSRLVGDYQVLHPIPFRSSKKFIRANLGLLLENPAEYLLLERDLRGLRLEELFSFFGRPVGAPGALRIKDRLYHSKNLEKLTQKIEQMLTERGGMLSLSELLSRLEVSEELLSMAVKELKEVKLIEGYLVDARREDITELKGYRELLSLLSQGIKEEKELESYQEYLRVAVRKGRVYSLGDYLYVSRELFEEYVNRLRALGKEFTIGQAKERLGLSRKYLLPLLEHMDRLGITKREDNRRVFLR